MQIIPFKATSPLAFYNEVPSIPHQHPNPHPCPESDNRSNNPYYKCWGPVFKSPDNWWAQKVFVGVVNIHDS